MIDKIVWRITPITILVLSAVAGAYGVLRGTTIWVGVMLAFYAILFGVMIWLMIIGLSLSVAKRPPSLIEMILDAILSYARCQSVTWLRCTGVFSLAFFVLSIIWFVGIYQVQPDVAVDFLKTSLPYEVLFLFFMMFGWFILFLSRLTATPKLFTRLSEEITPELVGQKPQAAIEHAFTIFEDHLRQRLGVGPEVYGERLINDAFGQNGQLDYGAMHAEQQGVRNLVAGAYAVFRNPRKHRVVKDDEQTVYAVLTLVDLFMGLVDKSTLRNSTSQATNGPENIPMSNA